MTVSFNVPDTRKRQRLMQLNEKWLKLTPSCIPFDSEKPGVIINPRSLTKLDIDKKKPIWVQVLSVVHNVIIDSNFPMGLVGIPTHDFAQLPKDHSMMVLKLYDAGVGEKPEVTDIGFEVTYIPSGTAGNRHVNLDVMDILSKTSAFFLNHFFRLHQELSIDFELGTLKFTVESLSLKDPKPSTPLNPRTYGFLTEETAVSLTTPPNTNLHLIYGCIECEDAIFHCTIETVGDSLPLGSSFPTLISVSELRTGLFGVFKEGYAQIPGFSTIETPSIGTLTIKVMSVSSVTNPRIHQYAVKLTDQHKFVFKSMDPHIKIVDGDAHIPESVVLSIESAEITVADQTFKPTMISVEELMSGLRAVPNGFVNQQRLSLPIFGGRAVVLVSKIYCRNVRDVQDHHWRATAITDVEFYTHEKDETILINNHSTMPVKAVTFRLYAPSWVRHTSIKHEDILRATEILGISNWVEGLRYYLDIPNKDYPIEVKVDSLEFEPGQTVPETSYHNIGSKTNKTLFRFTSGSVNLWLEQAIQKETVAQLENFLLERGFGGIPKNITRFLKTLASSKTKESPDLPEGMPKGILLHGPKGSGKKRLAEFMGELLGIPTLRISRIDGKVLVHRWNDEIHRTRSNFLRFCDTDGENDSPKRLVLIDNIQAIAPSRGAATSDSAIDSLQVILNELGSVRNLFIIGITTSVDQVCEAAKRPGQFYPHFHVSVPDLEGRKEIFKIHLKDKSVAEDVSVNRLAELTEGCTSAQIHEIIQKAISNLWVITSEPDDKNKVKITLKALLEAIKSTHIHKPDIEVSFKAIYN